ncbi:AAA family ATPase, partial [Streptomyces sp. SID8499]|nr:AAA family ATPase [Streptomyces sp. SID8499]
MRDPMRDSTPAEPSPGSGAAGNLPAELDAFVGRAAELDALARALGAARLVTVTGVGGVGKSRLAARAAARSTAPDGVWRVELAPL